MPRWSVDLIRNRTQHLGTVEAANEKQAIEAAINNTSGTLTVSDSIHTANVTLLGQYVTANFTKASDGHGGTLIGDPPLAITDTGPSAYTAAYTT
jgi:hypothetical protein